MQRKLLRLTIITAFALSFWQGAGSVFALSDTIPPSILSLSVSPPTVTAGNPVTITAHITDSDSGVAAAAICYNLPTGMPALGFRCPGFARISGTIQDGIWRAIFTVPPASASGTWTVNQISANDAAGNNVNLRPPTPPTPNGAFTVLGGNDTQPPAIQTLSVTPSTVGAGGIVTISARVTDNDTGVTDLSICYNLPNGTPALGFSCPSFSRISGSPQDGGWQTMITVPVASASGIWTVNQISADDAAGNSVNIRPPTPPTSGGAFTVVGGSDTIPPTIQSLRVSPATVTAGRSVTVTARITDTDSGVAGAAICYNLPDGTLALGFSCPGFTRISGTQQDGIWQATVTVPPASALGTWTVNQISADDAAGNNVNLRPPTLPTPDGAFTIVSPVQVAPPPRPAPGNPLPGPLPPVPLARPGPGTGGVVSPDPVPVRR